MNFPEVKIKICGLTRLRDVELAVRLGADMVGFVLAPKSPRRVKSIRMLKRLVEAVPRRVRTVGVVAGMSPEEINRILYEVPLDRVQLHGGEPRGFEYLLTAHCLRALPLLSEADLAELKSYGKETFLVDAAAGGSGVPCDWTLAARAARRYRVWLAGGICAENAAAAVQMVCPYGIDASSRLEDEPGIKSEKKMRELFQVLRGNIQL